MVFTLIKLGLPLLFPPSVTFYVISLQVPVSTRAAALGFVMSPLSPVRLSLTLCLCQMTFSYVFWKRLLYWCKHQFQLCSLLLHYSLVENVLKYGPDWHPGAVFHPISAASCPFPLYLFMLSTLRSPFLLWCPQVWRCYRSVLVYFRAPNIAQCKYIQGKMIR